MSKVNIKRAVGNIRSGTTVYTPLVETIVNAIQAIESKKEKNGEIKITVERSGQANIENQIPPVESFLITDNGVGFTDENRDSFDTLYSDYKIAQGGKGFGRFICLRYFEDLHVDSIYAEGQGFKHRTFSMGKDNDIIVNESRGCKRKKFCSNRDSFIRKRRKILRQKAIDYSQSVGGKTTPVLHCSKLRVSENIFN